MINLRLIPCKIPALEAVRLPVQAWIERVPSGLGGHPTEP